MKFMLMRKTLKYIFWSLMFCTLILFILSLFVVIENKEMRGNANPSFTCINTTKHQNIYKEIAVSDMMDPSLLTESNDSCGYNQKIYDWTNDEIDSISFDINIEDAGAYFIGLDYLSYNDSILDNAISIYINDHLQTSDAENMLLMTSWTDKTNEKVFDSNNNQVLTAQKAVERWDYTILRDHLMLYDGVSFHFEEGINHIEIVKENGKFLLGNMYIVKQEKPITYLQYSQLHASKITSENQMITVEAENSAYKNDISIIYENLKSPDVSPYNSEKNYINIVSQAFAEPGQKITYAFDVEKSGYYNITLKYMNNTYQNLNTYRKIYINDQIVFNGLQSYEFKYANDWINETLGNQEDYLFYLTKGINTLSLEVDGSHIANSYYQIQDIIDEIDDLSLKVKKLTGGQVDSKREWDLDKYLPEAKQKLERWSDEVDSIISDLKILNSNNNESNEIEKKLQTVQLKLAELKSNHNKLPAKLNLLSEGSSSVSQSLALVSRKLLSSPLKLDKLYIHTEDVSVPNPKTNVFMKIMATFQRIIAVAKPEETAPDTLEIWVNRSRFYIDLMQQMADSQFTDETGIKVKFSVMPDEGKLILANAAGTQPDVALGVSGWLPYELGLRGAAANLRGFDGFEEVLSNINPSAILNLMINNKVYGLPETQDFYVTYYRQDILDKLGLEVPETYEEIIEILPTLQRYGMNYYLPLSSNSALKAMASTAPFLYQYGSNIYSDDAFSVDFSSEEAIKAITMMTDLYTLYSLPPQTASFYNDFRDGTIPVGVGTFDTYNQLLFAAPEIANKWAIALAPGVRQDDGSVKRDYMGTAQSVVMFEKSDKKQEGFEFIKWWLSTNVQKQFIYNLQSIYGEGFLWNSANIEAFKTLPIEQQDIEVILTQWESLHEVPKIPAYYQVERELSNIWNKVIFESESVRNAVDEAELVTNREIKRRMIEFGYLDEDGNVLKEYILPSKEEILKWLENSET